MSLFSLFENRDLTISIGKSLDITDWGRILQVKKFNPSFKLYSEFFSFNLTGTTVNDKVIVCKTLHIQDKQIPNVHGVFFYSSSLYTEDYDELPFPTKTHILTRDKTYRFYQLGIITPDGNHVDIVIKSVNSTRTDIPNICINTMKKYERATLHVPSNIDRETLFGYLHMIDKLYITDMNKEELVQNIPMWLIMGHIGPIGPTGATGYIGPIGPTGATGFIG